ncbi:MAG: hypothetical protein E7399_08640 [Ruminococcaceae bacterium]|nr:hypothetical protein [Oscillospiraceae bacterium]
MKKYVAGFLILCCCFMLFGCNAEEKTYDQKFLKDFKQGLMNRWNLSDEIIFDSKANGEQFVNAELDQIEKYLTKKFEDTELQEKAIGYINLLKKQKDSLKYYDVDYIKHNELWNEALSDRSKYIMDFINEYDLKFPDKYKEFVDEFTVRAETVQENENLKNQIEEIKKTIQFEKAEQSYDYSYYEAIVENTTDKTFEYFALEINLIDSNDVIIESTYTSVDNWAPGQKTKFEFSTDVQFEKYEYEIDYYIQ